MRIYEPNDPTYQALKGSNIELTVTILNNQLQSLTDAAAATDWVQKNVQAYVPDIKFKYIAVGNEVRPGDTETQYLLPAIQNIHNAIVAANLQGQIKVSTAIDTTLVDSTSAFPPSAGRYSDAAKSFITPVIDFLASNGAPLLVNVYPYFSYTSDPANINLAYALFTSDGITTPDGVKYQNLFDALLDAQYSALEKANAPNVEIVVSESGWPSEGSNVATLQNAATFYQNLINHVKGTTGTPKRPGKAIETYLFAMFDENTKGGDEVEKHFGLFSPNKQPKYQLTF
ncbi:glucan endo-1 3-beta-glucosidase-like [Prunus yedoensis var. nudiflora]|uniref:glucan endo-1,3-beta-D-glucosidase n=1 Tax=Prunus yedoensis var. nudiflora TaxID=2094558 RepID=A0A314YPQ0_PRUYE|nr:glucan endo-1 3-beta-glucosidase-like [Prunus yedoensis var. nudiflora]